MGRSQSPPGRRGDGSPRPVPGAGHRGGAGGAAGRPRQGRAERRGLPRPFPPLRPRVPRRRGAGRGMAAAAGAVPAAGPVAGPGADAAGPGEEAAGPGCPGPARGARLPLARVKALVKADPDVSLASHEAVFVLARATELFVETIAKDAYVYAQQGKRKTLQRKDLDNAIEAIDEFAFLEGTLD
ncbi:DNA polymerase epsilon subunit 4 [Pezoporus wallicus]|uniref:DNA polymerase epsilon subunit 4 n=1 Tax=Pezoporus wallicus TaxID=35540 RepID=UPI00254AB825|nr:DNA polymerase epsilon subunit 4 [Pezoporus wallicus]XP_061322620.1 DNA polymerase epsilon subunit 4 [Pezoporus flaviventris]